MEDVGDVPLDVGVGDAMEHVGDVLLDGGCTIGDESFDGGCRRRVARWRVQETRL